MESSLKRLLSGIVVLFGLAIYFASSENIIVGIIGGVVFLLGINFFIDAKIEESRK